MTDSEAEQILKALANPARRRILQSLKYPDISYPDQTTPFQTGVCVGQIFARSSLSQSTVSSHLSQLQRAGLASATQQGQWVYYKRNEDTIKRFIDYLIQHL